LGRELAPRLLSTLVTVTHELQAGRRRRVCRCRVERRSQDAGKPHAQADRPRVLRLHVLPVLRRNGCRDSQRLVVYLQRRVAVRGRLWRWFRTSRSDRGTDRGTDRDPWRWRWRWQRRLPPAWPRRVGKPLRRPRLDWLLRGPVRHWGQRVLRRRQRRRYPRVQLLERGSSRHETRDTRRETRDAKQPYIKLHV
jgi:hypothetical protein